MNVSHTAHDVEMIRVYPSGDEEWYCPVCREHFILCMPCKTNIVFQTGSDSKASKQVKYSQKRYMAKKTALTQGLISGSLDDPYLEPWKNYLMNR